ncbi:MAG: nuclear transport factor 2 family protein [Actinomycetales bacterium]
MLSTRDVIDGIFADAASGNLADVMRWWADDGVLEDVTLAQAFSGRAQITAYLDMYYSALPGLIYQPIRLLVDGPTAVVEWAQNVTVAAPFDGVDATGTTLFLHAVDVFHVVDGLIQHESSWYGDGWLRQRLERAPGLPEAVPLSPPTRASGQRF